MTFREFLPLQIPKYAIASHRWKRDCEVSMRDILKKRNTASDGYQKILSFAEFIKEHIAEVQWLWIDTCCINQDSSAEVSEAINLMFRWYQNAEVCLAYLADVTIVEIGSKTNDTTFRYSDWFRRGWTLQELLAPPVVVFLTQRWQVIGHKAQSEKGTRVWFGPLLQSDISRITRVPEIVLREYKNSKRLSVHERLTWTANRRTTKEEDMAYCLLGIFDVSMVVNYGEGEAKARQRLNAEIYKDDTELNKLPIASDAAFDTYSATEDKVQGFLELSQLSDRPGTCLKGTRVALADQISHWARRLESTTIFWLEGQAGTGKSTFARAIAYNFQDTNQLGASFFFGESDRSSARKPFTTLARQLARSLPEYKQQLLQKLNAQPDIAYKSLKQQFEILLLQPLRFLRHTDQSYIIVLDALDECSPLEDVKVIINQLARLRSESLVQLRVFTTSRPELLIESGFKNINEEIYSHLTIQDLPKDVTQRDISIYLKHAFTSIRTMDQRRQLPHDWPTQAVIEALSIKANPLFIYAVTMCRFVADPKGSPASQLKIVLKNDQFASHLNSMYLSILEQLINDQQEQANVVEEVRYLIGSISALAGPLAVSPLSTLLNLEEEQLHCFLDCLRSVLIIPEDNSRPIELFHLSFRDFLFDKKNADRNRFWVDEAEVHRKMALRCITLLSQSECLKRDICNLSEPGVLRAQVDKRYIATIIPLEIQYACTYWVYHVERSKQKLRDNDCFHAFLNQKFLFWIEALAWLGKAFDSIKLVRALQSRVEESETPLISHLLNDAQRFLLYFSDCIDRSPLQLYASCLNLAPEESLLRKTFEKLRYVQISRLLKVRETWSAELQTLEGHSGWVWSVAFSLDGRLLASASYDKAVKLWDPATGALRQTLEGHSAWVFSVAFSPDGRLLASASYDTTVKLWDPATGALRQTQEDILGNTVRLLDLATRALQQTLEGHSDQVRCVAFSLDGRLLATGSHDNTVKLWDSATGALRQTLEGHSGWIWSVAFSPDSRLLASASYDKTVKLWNLATGALRQTLEGHTAFVWSVAFSPDGQVLASASDDRTVKLWDPASGAVHRTPEAHLDPVRSVKFSLDGRLLASASQDKTVKLWDPATGALRQTLEGHSGWVLSVAFSLDGRVLASGSHDNTVKLWDSATGALRQTLRGQSCSVWSVAFSPDDRLLAPASYRKVVLWDLSSGTLRQTLKSSLYEIRSIAFSLDGRSLVSISDNKTVELWELASGALQPTLDAKLVHNFKFSDDSVSLHTIVGDLDIRPWEGDHTSWPSKTDVKVHKPRGEWVALKNQNVLWLPPEYRAARSAVHNDIVVLGHSSGRVSFLNFENKKL